LRTAQRIGTFDELLFTAEDNDWAYRALRAGIPILYAPDAIVSHFHWRAASQLASTYLDYAWGQGNFYGKYLRRGDLLMLPMTGISLFRGARDLLFGILSHDNSRRLSGSARMKRLIPGILHGLLRSDTHP
jgi:GT2 family glycosyltransferase